MCKIRKELLTTKACSLGNTANSAAHHFDFVLDVQDSDCDKDESSDEDDESYDSVSDSFSESEHNTTKDTRIVLDLITQLNRWPRLEGPRLVHNVW